MYILGIDPGLSGALCWYDPERNVLDIQDMPTVKSDKGNALNGYELARMIDCRPSVTMAWIEQQHPRKGEKAPGAFKQGTSYGRLIGLMDANFIPYRIVAPQRWKPAMGVKAPTGTEDKDKKELSRAKAIQMWPAISGQFSRKMDADRAEAALIAYYGAHKGDKT